MSRSPENRIDLDSGLTPDQGDRHQRNPGGPRSWDYDGGIGPKGKLPGGESGRSRFSRTAQRLEGTLRKRSRESAGEQPSAERDRGSRTRAWLGGAADRVQCGELGEWGRTVDGVGW